MSEAVNKDYEVVYAFLRKYGRSGDVKKWKTSAANKQIALLDFRCLMENTLRVKREAYRIYDIKDA